MYATRFPSGLTDMGLGISLAAMAHKTVSFVTKTPEGLLADAGSLAGVDWLAGCSLHSHEAERHNSVAAAMSNAAFRDENMFISFSSKSLMALYAYANP
jgi:hypothetical protein